MDATQLRVGVQRVYQFFEVSRIDYVVGVEKPEQLARGCMYSKVPGSTCS
jgi:hypothetical protein